MILDQLSFGTFQEIEPNIVEIIVDEGVDIDGRHIEQIEVGLLEKYDSSYALLINRLHAYSHTHVSMQKVAELKNLAAIAIVVYSDISRHAAMIHKVFQNNVQVFDEKDSALVWLRASMKKSSYPSSRPTLA
jgi:hypothetical protein